MTCASALTWTGMIGEPAEAFNTGEVTRTLLSWLLIAGMIGRLRKQANNNTCGACW